MCLLLCAVVRVVVCVVVCLECDVLSSMFVSRPAARVIVINI